MTDLLKKYTGWSTFRLVVILAAACLGTIAGTGFYAWRDWRHYLESPEPALAEPHLIEVKKGMSFSHIMDLLQKEKVVSHPLLVGLEARRLNVTTQMKAGDYIFHPGLTPLQVLDMIIRGEITRVTLAVPEGFTIYDIAKRLSTLGPWTEEGFLAAAQDPLLAAECGSPIASVEGYLFPAVYSLKMSMDEKTVIMLMYHRAREEQNATRLARAAELNMTWHQVLTLASMLQTEAMQDGEMPLIAGVFQKRLRLGMPLQSDPTAVYGFKSIRQGITGADLRRPSPYNTYRIKGLPPGPICNPGLPAIKAALYPVDTEYLYFVADGRGRHYFARTYREHAQNVAVYRRGLARATLDGATADQAELERLFNELLDQNNAAPDPAPTAEPAPDQEPAPEEPGVPQEPEPPAESPPEPAAETGATP